MPTKPTQSFGRYGEQLAKTYLEQNGYQIVITNWRCSIGEIDIVAQQGNMLVFVEVRSRHMDSTEASFESITKRKQLKMSNAAEAYISEHQLENQVWRIDVIGVAIPRSGKAIIDHAEDALGW